jgi:transcriptional/translational regulatory protein YebC/TACO1
MITIKEVRKIFKTSYKTFVDTNKKSLDRIISMIEQDIITAAKKGDKETSFQQSYLDICYGGSKKLMEFFKDNKSNCIKYISETLNKAGYNWTITYSFNSFSYITISGWK